MPKFHTSNRFWSYHVHNYGNKGKNGALIHVKIDLPLGLELEEVEMNSSCGVYVASINEGSNAYKSGKLETGMKLIRANNVDVDNETFDNIMCIIASSPTSTLSFAKQDIKLIDMANNLFGATNLANLAEKIFSFRKKEAVEGKSLPFVFDENELWESDLFPPYLTSALMAGLNVLSNEKELKYESQVGRIVQYAKYREITPTWTSLAPSSSGEFIFESVEVATLQRHIDLPRFDEEMIGTFRIYKFKVNETISTLLNERLIEYGNVIRQIDEGMQVSNSGGYHSMTDGFDSSKNNEMIGDIVTRAVNFCEMDDHKFSNMDVNQEIRRFKSIENQEAWININNHGDFNSLHTHSGSTWSGIYYIQCPDTGMSRTTYSGKLLLKPSPHSTEVLKFPLTEIELARLNIVRPTTASQISAIDTGVCDWISVTPEEGCMLIIPSYLQHAVMPLNIREEHRCQKYAERISFAFNFAIIQ